MIPPSGSDPVLNVVGRSSLAHSQSWHGLLMRPTIDDDGSLEFRDAPNRATSLLLLPLVLPMLLLFSAALWELWVVGVRTLPVVVAAASGVSCLLWMIYLYRKATQSRRIRVSASDDSVEVDYRTICGSRHVVVSRRDLIINVAVVNFVHSAPVYAGVVLHVGSLRMLVMSTSVTRGSLSCGLRMARAYIEDLMKYPQLGDAQLSPYIMSISVWSLH
jgi:hypothetical protein